MLEILRHIDRGLLEMPSGDGLLLVSNALQGRVFAAFGNEIVHRFVRELAEHPDPVEFNNLGGNSLWPAPEGGDFAFNYPPDGEWRVQPGINAVPTATVAASSSKVVIRKEIELLNRRNTTLRLAFQREVSPLAPAELPSAPGLLATGYRTRDSLTPAGRWRTADALMAAWTLEQFPGAEGVIAFGRCQGPAEDCANDDFYGSAAGRLAYDGRVFTFALGGPSRLQIGIRAASRPELIGALDPQRGTLVIRQTPPRTDGTYFNIADNDQASGPFGAADMFSIFNGSQELDFHELETIAPLCADADGFLLPSALESTSRIYKGDPECLAAFLDTAFEIRLAL